MVLMKMNHFNKERRTTHTLNVDQNYLQYQELGDKFILIYVRKVKKML